jgi:hypothetical protein
MSEVRAKPSPATGPDVAATGDVRLDVTAQLITLAQGMFSVELEADDTAVTEMGMVLPAARLDPLPSLGEARAHFSTLAETSLVLPGTHPAFLRVTGGTIAVLLTIYKLNGASPPRLRVTALQPAPAATVRPSGPTPKPDSVLPSLPMVVTVHVSGYGDLTASGGTWAESPDAAAPIEGLSIEPQAPLDSDSLEYQAIMGQDWVSPWVRGGEFCGSRQLALALLGVRVRLRGAAAETYRCQIWGHFDGAEVGPFESGEPCEFNGASLQGLRVTILERPIPKGKRR